MELKELPDYGWHVSIFKFLKDVDAGYFTDYDGFGCLATKTKMSDIGFKPSNLRKRMIENTMFTYVVWFNR